MRLRPTRILGYIKMIIIRKDGTIETGCYLDSLYRDEKIYEDHGLNSRILSVEVKKGKVWMNESDSGPACAMMNGGESNSYDRDLYEINLKELMGAFECTTLDNIYAEMRKRFAFYDGFDRFGNFLEENKIKFAAYAG